MGKNGEIMLTAEDGSEEAFFVVEKAELAGREYLLVASQELDGSGGTADSDGTVDEEKAVALILRVNGEQTADDMVVYDVVEEERELMIVSKYFEELVEDLNLSM